jgi:hypothetical protein
MVEFIILSGLYYLELAKMTPFVMVFRNDHKVAIC